MQTYHIAWWNLENLFEVENSPNRTEWLHSYLCGELEGWTQAVLDTKLDQLARIIKMMNDGSGPDILGVSEVENKNVLRQLIGKLASLNRTYDIALDENEDKRGIDVAFLYDTAKFTKHEQFSYRVTKRTPTRDIFQVNFKTKQGRDLILVANHWPARMPSQLETEPYRIIAAETLSYWITRIHEIKGEEVPILIMGDFNDDPFNLAFTDYLLSSHNREKIMNARSLPWVFNLMGLEFGKGIGSVYYSGPYMFDQMLANKALIKKTADIQVLPETTQVNNFDIMAEGSYQSPRRFGRPSSSSTYDPRGFSDHFPISVMIKEK